MSTSTCPDEVDNVELIETGSYSAAQFNNTGVDRVTNNWHPHTFIQDALYF